MTSARIAVAAFDFDNTLTLSDTVVPFLRRVAPSWRLALSTVPRVPWVVPALARRDRDALRAVASDVVFRGRSVIDIERAAHQYAAEIVETKLRSDTVERLRWHHDAGHRVVIVSASYELYLRPVANHLGGAAVLGTRLSSSDGCYTGDLDGPNCRGVEKVRRLDAWLTEHSWTRNDVELYAYGDSAGDRELLAWADHPQWVNQPLATVAPTP